MDGIGLDNMLGTEELNKLFSGQTEAEVETSAEEGEQAPQEQRETEETAEVDFSDLFGNQPESVGSENDTEGNRETPESNNDSGTPQANLFSSIAKALRDEGVFPDLSDDTLKEVKDAATLKKMFDDEVAKSLDDRQKRIEQAINGGAASDELQEYQQALDLNQYLDRRDTYDTLLKEDEEGEKLRKQMMYQDYINRGFKHEKAVKLIQKSFDDGSDIEDAKEAFESCKDFYRTRVESYQQELESRNKKKRADEEKQYANLKKHILDNDSFYDGVKIDKATRQKAYDSITKPVYKDEYGNYLTAMQKYQREHPIEFMENVAILYALTGEFKSVDKLAKDKANKKIKSAFDEVANVLNNSKRNDTGMLSLANTSPDDRESWNLAF